MTTLESAGVCWNSLFNGNGLKVASKAGNEMPVVPSLDQFIDPAGHQALAEFLQRRASVCGLYRRGNVVGYTIHNMKGFHS